MSPSTIVHPLPYDKIEKGKSQTADLTTGPLDFTNTAVLLHGLQDMKTTRPIDHPYNHICSKVLISVFPATLNWGVKFSHLLTGRGNRTLNNGSLNRFHICISLGTYPQS